MNKLHEAQPWDALIKMANEIASNIAPGRSQELVASAVLQHMQRFWSRSMKAQIIDCLEMKDNQLSPAAIQAIRLLKEREAAAR